MKQKIIWNISSRSVQGNLEGDGPNSPFPLSTSQESLSSSVPSSPRETTCPPTPDAGIGSIAELAANERRNIYGLPHPQPNTTNQTIPTPTTSSSDDHVFAVPSPASSNRHCSSGVSGGRNQRPHSYHQQNFNQPRVHNHHHDQAHHSTNYYQHQNHQPSQHYHQIQHTASNDFSHSTSEYNSYQKHSGANNHYPSQHGQRHRALSEHW